MRKILTILLLIFISSPLHAGIFGGPTITTMEIDPLNEPPRVIFVVSDSFKTSDMIYLEVKFEKAFAKYGIHIETMSSLQREIAKKCLDSCPSDVRSSVISSFINKNAIDQIIIVEPIDVSNGRSCTYSTQNKFQMAPEFGTHTTQSCSNNVSSTFKLKFVSLRERKNVLVSEINSDGDDSSVGFYFSDAKTGFQQSISGAVKKFVGDKKVQSILKLNSLPK